MKLVSETGEALKTIKGYIITVNKHVDLMQPPQRQSVGLGEVNTAVTAIDQVAQQHAALSKKQARPVQALPMKAAECGS